jgi:branched-chain amino acid transport system ATP-binding protein
MDDIKVAKNKKSSTAEDILIVNNIEVVYSHVILVLKGVSLKVKKGGITALLGGNGAGKSTTLKSISNLLASERGEVTKGSVSFSNEYIHDLDPAQLVKKGVIQVMEGRHCFEHLTVEENLLTGAYTRSNNKEVKDDLERVYNYFPRLRDRRTSLAGYTSGGEQQMIAIGRALMAHPTMILLDEPSMGLAPQLVKQIFEIVAEINRKEGVTILLAEQNTNVALQYAEYAYILENGRVVMEGSAESMRDNEDVKEFYLGISEKVDNHLKMLNNIEDVKDGCKDK